MLDLSQKSITLIGADCNHIEKLITVADHCESLCRFTKVTLLTDKPISDERVVAIPSLTSAEAYNEFVFKRLNAYIDTEYALLVQYDGYIQNPQAWTDEFLAYDYIGAPWKYQEHNVGNGGFTLRSKRLLERLQNDATLTMTMPEDEHICRTYRSYLETKGIKFAPEELAARFSIEGNIKYGFAWHGQFGFHNFTTVLGITVPYATEEIQVTKALRHLVSKRLRPQCAQSMFLCRNFVKNDTITAAGDLLLTALAFFVIRPLLLMADGRDRCAYVLEIREHQAYPDSLWLVARAENDTARSIVSEWRDGGKVFRGVDVIFEREIPRTQRTFSPANNRAL